MFGLFGNSVVKSVENIATEFIETDMEKAEAKSLFVKTLDPNGLMRRDISNKLTTLYIIYIITTMILMIVQSYGFGYVEGTKLAIESLKELFVPITTMVGGIVGASFGVNGMNAYKGK